MKTEKILGWAVTLVATLVIIWGLSTEIIWGYELACLVFWLAFIFFYNREDFKPPSKGLNFIAKYVGLAVCVGMGRLMMSADIYGIVAVLIIIPVLLCFMTALVPKIAYQLGFRSKNKMHFPQRTMVLFVITILLAAIFQ